MSERAIRVVAGVIERGGRYLITQRRATAVLPLLWEFPGGRVEPGETDAQALRREVLHRLGVDVTPGVSGQEPRCAVLGNPWAVQCVPSQWLTTGPRPEGSLRQ